MSREQKTGMVHKISQEGDVLFVALEGDLCSPEQDALQKLLDSVARRECRVLILDLSNVEYIASFAVAAIGYYCKILSDKGRFFALVLGEENMRKPFRLAGLERVIPIYPSVEAAQKAATA